MRNFSQSELRDLAGMCGGVVLILFAALFISHGGLQEAGRTASILNAETGVNLTAATALGDAQGVPAYGTGKTYPAYTYCYLHPYDGYGDIYTPLCDSPNGGAFFGNPGDSDTFAAGVFSVDLGGNNGRTVYETRTYMTSGNDPNTFMQCSDGSAVVQSTYCIGSDGYGNCGGWATDYTCSTGTPTCSQYGGNYVYAGGPNCYNNGGVGPPSGNIGAGLSSISVPQGQAYTLEWSCLPSRGIASYYHTCDYTAGVSHNCHWNGPFGIYNVGLASSLAGSTSNDPTFPSSTFAAQGLVGSVAVAPPAGTYTYNLNCYGGTYGMPITVTVTAPPNPPATVGGSCNSNSITFNWTEPTQPPSTPPTLYYPRLNSPAYTSVANCPASLPLFAAGTGGVPGATGNTCYQDNIPSTGNAYVSVTGSSPNRTYTMTVPGVAGNSYIGWVSAANANGSTWAYTTSPSFSCAAAGTCPTNCPGSYPSCVANSGYSYNSSNNTCNSTTACPANCPGTYPSCVANSGYSYNSGSNTCTPPLCSSASGGGATGTHPSCTCNTAGYNYNSSTNACTPPLCSSASGGGATGTHPSCTCNTAGYNYNSSTNACTPPLCSAASGGGATGTWPSCTCNTATYLYTSSNNSCTPTPPPTATITSSVGTVLSYGQVTRLTANFTNDPTDSMTNRGIYYNGAYLMQSGNPVIYDWTGNAYGTFTIYARGSSVKYPTQTNYNSISISVNPRTIAFTIGAVNNPPTYTGTSVTYNTPAQIYWSASNYKPGTTCTVTDNGAAWASGNSYGNSLSGMDTPNITSQHQYQMHCTGDDDVIQHSAVVTVDWTRATASLTATPPTGTGGTIGQVFWSSSNQIPGSCAVTQRDPSAVTTAFGPVVDNNPSPGTATAALNSVGTYTYVLTCKNADGSNKTAQDTIAISAGISIVASTTHARETTTGTIGSTTRFTITPSANAGASTITFNVNGSTATRGKSGDTSASGTDYYLSASNGSISSTTNNGTTVTISGTPIIIFVTPINDAVDENDETVVFTMTGATGSYTIGTASATVTIDDNDGVPAITTFTASPARVRKGNGTTLTWTGNNLSGCNVSAAPSGPGISVTPNGSMGGSAAVTNINVKTIFTLSCTGVASQTTTVNLQPTYIETY